MPRKAATRADHAQRMAGIVHGLETSLDEPLDLEALARRAGYAKHHFHRVFRGVIGESVAAHVRRLRLERAARRLRAGASNVTDAAFDAGYDAAEAFTRAFAQHFGVAPSEYRDQPAPRVRALAPALGAPDVIVRIEPAVQVAGLRHVGGWAGVGAVFEQLVAIAREAGLEHRLYGLCPDDPDVTPEALLRFDACVALGDHAAPHPLVPHEIPAGRYAIAVHRGPYTTLSETYLRLIGRWLPHTDYTLSDEPVVEVYLDDARVTPPEQVRTEVRVRIDD